MKKYEGSFCQLLFLISEVLSCFSTTPTDWLLPAFSHFSFLIPLHWIFFPLLKNPKNECQCQSLPPARQELWAVEFSCQLEASQRELQCSAVLPSLYTLGKARQRWVLLWKYGISKGKSLASKQRKQKHVSKLFCIKTNKSRLYKMGCISKWKFSLCFGVWNRAAGWWEYGKHF